MIDELNILAAGKGDATEFIIMVVVCGVIYIINAVQKAAKKQHDKQMEEQRLRRIASPSTDVSEPQADEDEQDEQEERVVWEAPPPPPVQLAQAEQRYGSAARSSQPPRRTAARQHAASVPRRTHLPTAAAMEHDDVPHMGHLSAVEQAHMERRHTVAVDMSSQDVALRAIIYQEILSPPKSLRSAPEMWEI